MNPEEALGTCGQYPYCSRKDRGIGQVQEHLDQGTARQGPLRHLAGGHTGIFRLVISVLAERTRTGSVINQLPSSLLLACLFAVGHKSGQ